MVKGPLDHAASSPPARPFFPLDLDSTGLSTLALLSSSFPTEGMYCASPPFCILPHFFCAPPPPFPLVVSLVVPTGLLCPPLNTLVGSDLRVFDTRIFYFSSSRQGPNSPFSLPCSYRLEIHVFSFLPIPHRERKL